MRGKVVESLLSIHANLVAAYANKKLDEVDKLENELRKLDPRDSEIYTVEKQLEESGLEPARAEFLRETLCGCWIRVSCRVLPPVGDDE